MNLVEPDTTLRNAQQHDRERRQLLIGFLHIAAINALAVAQPLLAVLGEQAEFFVAHDAKGTDIVFFAALLLVALPALVIAGEFAAWLVSQRVYSFVHAAFVAMYAALFAAQILARFLDLPIGAHGVALIAVGGSIGVAYWRYSDLRTFLTFLAPAPVIIGALFVFASPASGLILPEPIDDVVVASSSSTNVVFLLVDELPTQSLLDATGNIDAESFPSFARLASMSDWFPNATTLSDATHIAVPSILSGTEPDPSVDRLPVVSDYPLNVFTAMAPTHKVFGSERITELCPDAICGVERRTGFIGRTRQMIVDSSILYAHVIVPEGTRYRLPNISEGWADFVDIAPATSRTAEGGLERDRFEEFVDALGSFDDSALYFLHSVLPHRPWLYSEDGILYEPSEVPGHDPTHPAKWLSNEYLVSQGFLRHRAQLRFTDHLLGEMLDRLDAEGILDESVVIVAADHGINFQPDEHDRTATLETYDQILSIPLFIKAPGQSVGSTIETPVEIVDILATILDLVGLPWQDRTDGHSIYDSDYLPSEKRFFNDVEEVMLGLSSIDIMTAHADVESMVARSTPPQSARWIGVSTDAFVSQSTGMTATVSDLQRMSNVDLGTEPLPLHVLGRIEGKSNGDDVVLLAVNGTIAATGFTFADGPVERKFSLLIPSSSLRNGANELRIFVVLGDDVIHEVQIADVPSFDVSTVSRLVVDRGATYLEDGSGNLVALADSWLKAGVDSDTRIEDGTRSITGWAFDRTHSAPIDLLLVFGSEGELLQEIVPNANRPDVAQYFAVVGIDPSGWAVIEGSATAEGIRLVAVASGSVAEIKLP